MEGELKGSEEHLLDLVFICDCTASMDNYIDAAKETIKNSGRRKVQFGLIAFRDHPPEELSYVTKIFPFTESAETAKSYVNTLSAAGGGDRPEAVAAALAAALEFPFRAGATRIAVLVADAPPHGLSNHKRDAFPEGSPDGADPILDARRMAERGIILYTVGCEPALSVSPFAGDFYKAIAALTGGRYIPLGNAGALPTVIIGSAEEEIRLEKLSGEMEMEAERVREAARKKNKEISEEQVCAKVTKLMQSRGVQTRQLRVDHIGVTEELSEIAGKITECADLKEVREMLSFETPPSLMSPAEFGGYVAGGGCAIVPLGGPRSRDATPKGTSLSSAILEIDDQDIFSSQGVHVEDATISLSQVMRVMRRQRSRSRARVLAFSF